MAKLRVAVALMVSAAALMHWATGEPASALVPALVVVMYTFATHFHPKVVRKRIGIVSGARFISVFAAVAAWDTAVAWLVGLIAVQVLHSFGVAVDESTAAHAAFYAVYSIPLSLALKTQRPEMNAVTRLLVAVLYDPPIHMLVVRPRSRAASALLLAGICPARHGCPSVWLLWPLPPARQAAVVARSRALQSLRRPPRPAFACPAPPPSLRATLCEVADSAVSGSLLPIACPQYAYAALGWRLNSLATPVAAGEVLLGALPYASDAASLRARGVTGVVNMCAEWPGPTKQYDALGIEQLHLPTTDGDMPSADAAIAVSPAADRHQAPPLPLPRVRLHPARLAAARCMSPLCAPMFPRAACLGRSRTAQPRRCEIADGVWPMRRLCRFVLCALRRAAATSLRC